MNFRCGILIKNDVYLREQKAGFAESPTSGPLSECRVTATTAHRDVMWNVAKYARRLQILTAASNNTTIRGAERYVESGQLPFESRLLDFSVRFPLSLQNGVFRSLGDAGAQGPPILKPEPIRVVTVLLLTRLRDAIGQSWRLCATV